MNRKPVWISSIVIGAVVYFLGAGMPAPAHDASNLGCPRGYQLYETLCHHDDNGDVVNPITMLPQLTLEASCATGFWQFSEVCVDRQTGDVVMAEQTQNAQRR